jgi:hypothetical protein
MQSWSRRELSGDQSTAPSTPSLTRSRATLDIYADLFDENLDGVADRLGAAIQATADGQSSLSRGIGPHLLKLGGAKGIRTPDLLDANESRYQLRHSP